MRTYGANKSTEFTKNQINVIYALNKSGALVVAPEKLKKFYDLADYYGFDDNRNVERAEAKILRIINAVFNNDYEEAQRLINKY